MVSNYLLNKKLKENLDFYHYLEMAYMISICVLIKKENNIVVSDEEISILERFKDIFFNSGLLERVPSVFIECNTIFKVLSFFKDDFDYYYPYETSKYYLGRRFLKHDDEERYNLLNFLVNCNISQSKNPYFIINDRILSFKEVSDSSFKSAVISILLFRISGNDLDEELYRSVKRIKYLALFNGYYDEYLLICLLSYTKTGNIDKRILNKKDLGVLGMIIIRDL